MRKNKFTVAMREAANAARNNEINNHRKDKKAATHAPAASKARVYHEAIRVSGATKEALDAVKAPARAREAAARADVTARMQAAKDRKKFTRARTEARTSSVSKK